MDISVKMNFDLSKLDIGTVCQIGLVKSSQKLIKTARKNAPYDTGKLKQSIDGQADTGSTITESTSETGISKSTRSVYIGPRKVVYAIRREYENKKNPDRKFYMRRTGETSGSVVKEEFEKAINIVVNYIKK